MRRKYPRYRPKYYWWTTYWGYLLCGFLGHIHGGRFFERGNEFCDCGADHTYYGCIRCRTALDEPEGAK